ncbi:ShlB/FhaC/HecB family hemolysin secretion/activation protein [Sphingomonas sp. 1P06PA]|uniref:ShlB/FhaC/HecB family hemolysin secretion/activation protein n=1 Tax=Sphingomonas sp. 1P06PA TaxID=554121 RepID=UPI0039A68D12
MRIQIKFLAAAGLAMTMPVQAQNVLDRADPTITRDSLPTKETPAPPPAISVEGAPDPTAGTRAGPSIVAGAIRVIGNEVVPTSAFAPVFGRFVGQSLDASGLRDLARAVADVARGRGLAFATASIQPQSMAGGLIEVTLDEGRIDAVRALGASNAAAERILDRLRGRRAITRSELERTLLAIGDIPGVRVKESRFVRQDGFGILLVTIVEDRANAFFQVDNRGSSEVGPIRSTLLANLRGVATAGDEIGLLAANTPNDPKEFAFFGARYALPVIATGGRLTFGGSYGRSNPGASLSAFDVVGKSVEAYLSYSHALIRRKAHSLWAGLELRGTGIDQDILGRPLRRDRLTTLAVSINGRGTIAGGTYSSELTVTAGLPVGDATREGDLLSSRDDGDARFVTAGFAADWDKRLSERLSLRLASAGQLASRPLLATAEIGAGGPTFGRAYDYSERTGDSGILGSAELRLDFQRGPRDLIERLQLYGFVDGGYVDNLRNGFGGGSLLSSGAGVRLGWKRIDLGFEMAVPLNADRFDSRDRTPRASVRAAMRF